MQDKTIVKLASIFGIVFIEAVALVQGVNGVLLSLSVAALSGIAGYTIRSQRAESTEFSTRLEGSA